MRPTFADYPLGFVRAENAPSKGHWLDVTYTFIGDKPVTFAHHTEYEWRAEDSGFILPKGKVYCGNIEASDLWCREEEWSEYRLYMTIPLTVYLISIGAVDG